MTEHNVTAVQTSSTEHECSESEEDKARVSFERSKRNEELSIRRQSKAAEAAAEQATTPSPAKKQPVFETPPTTKKQAPLPTSSGCNARRNLFGKELQVGFGGSHVYVGMHMRSTDR